jgi:Peptidase C13 family
VKTKSSIIATPDNRVSKAHSKVIPPRFLAFAGGGEPSYNEIALEKNALYFQRTLKVLGYDPAIADIYFANGNNGQATVRYLDRQNREQFKIPKIPDLRGASKLDNLHQWFQKTAAQPDQRPIFFYFTGHGSKNHENIDNNLLWLWESTDVSVQQLTRQFDKISASKPIVAMMAQCYSGSFANLIYTSGNPNQKVAIQTRCGFFATVSTRPSVGCTPEVDEADYQDYSSSFFAGLSGYNRLGKSVPSADYDGDSRVSYAEAHAFAKVDEHASDWPISTSEAWLQRQASRADRDRILAQPIDQLLETARPEQRFVVNKITTVAGIETKKSWQSNHPSLKIDDEGNSSLDSPVQAFFQQIGLTPKQLSDNDDEIQQAYLMRLKMELINIGMEQRIRAKANSEAVAILDRLIDCEHRSWGNAISAKIK